MQQLMDPLGLDQVAQPVLAQVPQAPSRSVPRTNSYVVCESKV